LRRRGFIEGQNLAVEYRAYGLHSDLISDYAAELVKAQVDILATSGDGTARAVQQATKTIPIVAIVTDLLGSRLVTSLARPEGNMTGINIQPGELDGKRQELLIEAVPGLRRMAVLTDVNQLPNATKIDVLQEAAHAHNVRPCIIGYGSSPSRCGPVRLSRRPNARSPGSCARSVCTCQVL
jgi:putative tryptophan/tyrosine transport system substrate-binding protein